MQERRAGWLGEQQRGLDRRRPDGQRIAVRAECDERSCAEAAQGSAPELHRLCEQNDAEQATEASRATQTEQLPLHEEARGEERAGRQSRATVAGSDLRHSKPGAESELETVVQREPTLQRAVPTESAAEDRAQKRPPAAGRSLEGDRKHHEREQHDQCDHLHHRHFR